mgnify:CR=1 FL=1
MWQKWRELRIACSTWVPMGIRLSCDRTTCCASPYQHCECLPFCVIFIICWLDVPSQQIRSLPFCVLQWSAAQGKTICTLPRRKQYLPFTKEWKSVLANFSVYLPDILTGACWLGCVGFKRHCKFASSTPPSSFGKFLAWRKTTRRIPAFHRQSTANPLGRGTYQWHGFVLPSVADWVVYLFISIICISIRYL